MVTQIHWLELTVLMIFVAQGNGLKNNETDALIGKIEHIKYDGCRKDGISLDQQICLEKGYYKTEPPFRTNTTVQVSIRSIIVREIDDTIKILTFEYLASMTWIDPRIKVKFFESEPYKDIRESKAKDMLWRPLIIPVRRTNRKETMDSLDVKNFRLMPNDELGDNVIRIEYKLSGKNSVYCYPWNLNKYPLDHQSCLIRFYQRTSYDLNLVVSSPYEKWNQTYIAAGFEVLTIPLFGKTKNIFDVHLKLRRLIRTFVITCYLPSITIVCISGSSFLLPTNPLPGRIGLGVTNFLTLTHLLVQKTVRSFLFYLCQMTNV